MIHAGVEAARNIRNVTTRINLFMQQPLLIQIKTADSLTLPGLLYQAKNSKKVLTSLHGNGSSSIFYHDDLMADFAQVLDEAGISLLMFNNRGAHYIKKLNVEKEDGTIERKQFGMAYELIKDCVYDIDGAINFLKKEGYNEYYLIGFSTGANKICVYDHYKPKNAVARYILAGGGDDIGLYYQEFGKEKFLRLLKESRQKIRQGKGEELICELLPDIIFSYQAFFDTINADGDYNTFPFLEAMGQANLSTKPLFRYFKGIKKQTLVVYGEKDEYQYDDVKRVVSLLQQQQPTFAYDIIQDADHGFSIKQKELAEVVVEWLQKT